MLKRILALTLMLSLLCCVGSPSVAKTRAVELNTDNTLIFDSEVNEISVNTFVRALIGLRNELPMNQKLYVIIASPGGQYGAGKKLLAFMDRVPNMELVCKYCASAAGMLFIASKHRRLVIEKSDILMHEMYLAKVTAITASNPFIIKDLVSASEEFNKMHYSRIGMTREAYMNKIKDKVWNVWGGEALKLHLADEQVVLHCNDYIKMLAPKTCNPKKDDDE